MPDGNERIGFSVDVTTGKSTENLDNVVKQIDTLKNRINDLKKQKKKADEVSLKGLNDSIREAQRELNKLNSIYTSWIQKATNINTKPIGDVKRQLQELQQVLNSWTGNPKDFQKQILDRFLIPNSAVEQARLYRETIRQIEGLTNAGAISTQRAALATNRFKDALKEAENRAKALKNAVDGIPNATKRLSDRTVQQVFANWDGNTKFLSNFAPAKSYSKELTRLKNIADELAKSFGDSSNITVQQKLKKAIDEVTAAYREQKRAKDALNEALTGDQAEKAQKKAEQEAERAKRKAEQEAAKAQKKAEQDTAKEQARIAREQAKAEREAAKEQARIAKEQAKAEQAAAREQERLAKEKAKREADAARQQAKLAVEQAKAEAKAANVQQNKPLSSTEQYRKMLEQLEEVQNKIRMNYIQNYGTDRETYGKNLAPLRAEYKELSSQIKGAERDMSNLAFKSNMLGETWDRILHRMNWIFASFGAVGIFGGFSAYIDSMVDVEKNMAQFAQVMSHNQKLVEGFSEALNTMPVDKLAQKISNSSWTDFSNEIANGGHSVNIFNKALHEMNFDDLKKNLASTANESKVFQSDLDSMQQSLLNLAIKYGEANEHVIESATLWGRMYKDNDVVLTMTDAAMKLAVADSFSVVQANKNLESSVAQWGFSVENATDAMIVSNKVCDSWTAIAHNMAVSAQDLSAANQRSAAAMHAAGIEFDVGQALLATMLRNTQQAGGEIGNAMKSIVGSIHSKKAIEEIQKMGVAVYEFDENGSKHFRNVGNVLVDLMIKSQGAEKNLENMLQKISGGKWQWNKAGAMLNYADFIRALTLSTQSYGFTQEQVAMQLDTLSRKFETLRQQLAYFANGTGNISEALKGLLDIVSTFLRYLDNMDSASFALLTTGAGLYLMSNRLATAFTACREAIKGLRVETTALAAVDTATSMTSAAKGATALATASKGATTAVSGIGAAATAGVPALKAVAVALMAVVGVYELISQMGDENSSLKEQGDLLTKNISTQEELLARQKKGLEEIPLLADALKALKEQQSQLAEGSEEAKKNQENYNATRRALVDIIGEENTAQLENADNTKECIDSIVQNENERQQNMQSNIDKMKQDLYDLTETALRNTQKRLEGLDFENKGWGKVGETILEVGGIVDWLHYKFLEANQGAANIFKKFDQWRIDYYNRLKDSGTQFIMGQNVDMLIAGANSSINYEDQVINDTQAEKENLVKKVRANALNDTINEMKQLNASFTSDSNALNQKQLGGSLVDESGDKKSKKKRKPKIRDMEGNELSIPNASNYLTESGVDRNVTQDTELKLRIMDEAFYRKFGQHLLVSSMKRNGGGGSKHDSGLAFDLVGDILENNPEARQWLSSYGSWIGLTALDEYLPENYQYWQGKPDGGPNLHFSNNGPNIYDILGSQAKRNSNFTDNSPQRKLYDTLKELGLTDKQAWAAMASIGGESGFDPGAIESGKSFETGGIGLMQWTADRKDAYLEFVRQRAAMGGSSDWRDITNQLEFLKQEFRGNQASYWNDFLASVTSSTTAEDDVRAFTSIVERAGIPNIENRMQYYNDISSHYVNGKSLYDSDPSKKKQLTPEQLAEKEAKRLQKYYNTMIKTVDVLSKAVSEKYKYAMDAVNEEQTFFGQNMVNTSKQLDVYQAQMADQVNVTDQYQKVLEKVANNLSDDKVKNLFNMSKSDFLKLEVEEQQKLIAGVDAESSLYKPILATLNAIVTAKQKIRESDEQYHQDQLKWIQTYQNRLKMRYDKPIQSENDKIREWEITHSNDQYDETYRNIFEQQHLEEIARLQKDKYDDMQEYLYDANGNPIVDRAGNKLRGENNPEQIEKQKQAWLEADAAAQKYASTLKNSVVQQFTEMSKSILLEGVSLKDKLKELWKQLAEDALTLLISGGKQGTNSPLGNLLRLFDRKRGRDDKDSVVNPNNPYGFNFPYNTTFSTYATDPFSDYRTGNQYRPSITSVARAAAFNEPVVGVDPLTGKHFATVNSATMGSPVPVLVTNTETIANNIGGAIEPLANDLPAGTAIPNSAYSFDANGNVKSLAPALQGAAGFATKYNWGVPTGGGWGSLALGNKLGIFANTLPWLFSLFRHHASGGKIDKEEIATLGENDQTEYVIPTEQNRPRGVSLWKKAGEDLGVLSSGSPVVPNFKNRQIAANGVMSVQVKQQAVYMEQMKRQNETLLNILAYMANNQSEGGNGTVVAQPVVVKQSMDINEFSAMYKKGQQYGYVK